MAQVNLDGLNLEMSVGVEKNINSNRSKLDILVDEDGKATTTTTRPITSQKRISRKGRIRIIRTELSFLDARDLDIVLVKVRCEFAFRCVDSIGVELEDARNGRRRSWARRSMRARVRGDSGDEEEDEDEETREREIVLPANAQRRLTGEKRRR